MFGDVLFEYFAVVKESVESDLACLYLIFEPGLFLLKASRQLGELIGFT
jgi:hypothetical protein